MNMGTYYEDEITKLQYEYKSLKDEILRNNQQIQKLQIRDMESIENMRRFLDRKRQLNNRTKHLKLLILKNYLDRRGCSLKMDEWLTALNISPEYAKTEDDAYRDPTIMYDLSELDVNVEQKLDKFIDELRYKVENVVNTVNSGEGKGTCDEGDSDGIHIDKVGEINSESIESLIHFFQQPPPIKLVEKRDTQTSPHKPSPPMTTDQQVQTGEDIEQPKYPVNVEFKSLTSPPPIPLIPATEFATKYDIKRNRNSDQSTTESRKKDKRKSKLRHKDVGDYMLHRGNISVSKASSSQPQEWSIRVARLVIIVAIVSAICYFYPDLPNCLLLLKDSAEHTRDGLAHLLDSIIVWYPTEPPAEPEPVRVVEPDPESTWRMITTYLQNLYAQIISHFEH